MLYFSFSNFFSFSTRPTPEASGESPCDCGDTGVTTSAAPAAAPSAVVAPWRRWRRAGTRASPPAPRARRPAPPPTRILRQVRGFKKGFLPSDIMGCVKHYLIELTRYFLLNLYFESTRSDNIFHKFNEVNFFIKWPPNRQPCLQAYLSSLGTVCGFVFL